MQRLLVQDWQGTKARPLISKFFSLDNLKKKKKNFTVCNRRQDGGGECVCILQWDRHVDETADFSLLFSLFILYRAIDINNV